MGNALEYYKQAELAFAAYATLGAGTPSTVELTRDSVGMATAQAAKFAAEIKGAVVGLTRRGR